MNHPAQDECFDNCLPAFVDCCDGSFDDGTLGKCDVDEKFDYDLYFKCLGEMNDCLGKCPTKVTTDFDVDIEGAFVEEA